MRLLHLHIEAFVPLVNHRLNPNHRSITSIPEYHSQPTSPSTLRTTLPPPPPMAEEQQLTAAQVLQALGNLTGRV